MIAVIEKCMLKLTGNSKIAKSRGQVGLQFSFSLKIILYIIGKSFEVSYQLDHGFDIMINTLFLCQIGHVIITNTIVLSWF